jgi:hypothetical protein
LRAISFPDKLDVHSDIKALADYTVELGKSALSIIHLSPFFVFCVLFF